MSSNCTEQAKCRHKKAEIHKTWLYILRFATLYYSQINYCNSFAFSQARDLQDQASSTVAVIPFPFHPFSLGSSGCMSNMSQFPKLPIHVK